MPQKKKLQPVKIIIAFFSFLVVLFPARGQEASINFDIAASFDWRAGELNARTSFNLAQAGLRIPSGRLRAETILAEAWPRLFRPYLLSLRVDSEFTLGNLVDRGELSLHDLDSISLGAKRTPPNLSADMTSMIGRYTVAMENISELLLRGERRRATLPSLPLVPVQTADYTGIIILAYQELPVRGRNSKALVEPCLFPKIWDTNMNLVYDRYMTEAAGGRMVRYTETETVFRPTPSGLEGEIAALAGPRPLRIFAREVFGIYPTDPVIDRDDALQILSSENNRRLLREGRVVLVLDAGRLGN